MTGTPTQARLRQVTMRTLIENRLYSCLLLVIAALASTPVSAQRKQDQVVMVNGDRFVGEIKELSQGELLVKTDYIRDAFNVDWAQVQELESQDLFRVEVRDGRRLTGTIARRADGSFTVVAPVGVRTQRAARSLGPRCSSYGRSRGASGRS